VTVTDLAAAAHRVDSRRARSRQRKMGPSSVGGCRRRAAYLIADVKPTDPPGNKMKAILGTWVHKGALDVLKREFGALIEVAVEDEMLRGSADALYLPTVRDGQLLIGGTVEDVKTMGLFAFEWRQQAGVAREHLFQAHLYAWLLREGKLPKRTLRRLRQAGWTSDTVPIEQVVIRYICRDNGDEWVHAQDYDPKVTAAALEWIAEVCDTTAELGPEFVDRDEDGPGLSVICDGCRWLTACWGPERDDGALGEHTMRQASLVRDDADVAEALRDYDRARALEKEAKEAKALARAKLTDSEAGQYGDLMLTWSGGGAKRVVDMDAVRALYLEAGLELPYKRITAAPSIGVKLPPRAPVRKVKTRDDLLQVLPSNDPRE
jgi:hypothetical protein